MGTKWTNFGKTAAGLAIAVGGGILFFVYPDRRDEAMQLIYTGAGLMGVGIGHKLLRKE